MPISEERLQAEVNAHILANANETVKETLRRWKTGHSQWGMGREWWWLIIQYDTNRFGAIPFEDLRELLMDSASGVTGDSLLANLPPADHTNWRTPKPGVIAARTVEQNTHSTASALHLTENSPGNLLVVTRNGQLLGILNKRMRNFAMASLSLLSLLDEMETASVSPSATTPPPDATPPKPAP
jgi:hypothetical protein